MARQYDSSVADTPPSADVTTRVERLRSEIGEHNRRYHRDDAPTISDAEYDALVRELRGYEDQFPELIVADSPTQMVGGPASTLFAPVVHRVPMTSLDNSFSAEELVAWGERVERRLARRAATPPRPMRLAAGADPWATAAS